MHSDSNPWIIRILSLALWAQNHLYFEKYGTSYPGRPGHEASLVSGQQMILITHSVYFIKNLIIFLSPNFQVEKQKKILLKKRITLFFKGSLFMYLHAYLPVCILVNGCLQSAPQRGERHLYVI